MANPKKKQTPRRSRLRRSTQKIEAPNLVSCTNCGKMILSHRVCEFCGYYNEELIIPPKTKKDKKKGKEEEA